ncbi:ECF transporter S component [bacterium]|nr:ECF transporter S component [bacterium]
MSRPHRRMPTATDDSLRVMPTAMITGTALLLALGVVLPIVFHMIPFGGRIFLPMHIPALLAGLLLGPVSGLIVGLGSPILSGMLTGRPTVFYMIPMLFELGTYGLIAGLLRTWFARMMQPPEAREMGYAPTLLALIAAMVIGRAVWLAVVIWLAPYLGINARTPVLALGALGAGWIGMAIHIAGLPALVRALERTRVSRRPRTVS